MHVRIAGLVGLVAYASTLLSQQPNDAGIIYAVHSDRNVYFYQDLARNGTANWKNNGIATVVAADWSYEKVFSGSNGIIYAIDSEHKLWFYRDLARDGTSSNWAYGGARREIGTGWAFRHVFSGGNGTIYAIAWNGEVSFYKDVRRDGLTGYILGPRTIANGWDYEKVFSGGNGVIYAIAADGNLYYYRDLSRNGVPNWANNGARQLIGTNWERFSHVFSGGDGIIYAIDSEGYLYYYRYLGHGEINWANPTGLVIGYGWNFAHVFADGPADTILEGYASPQSVARGGQINFHVSTTASQYKVEFYRLKKAFVDGVNETDADANKLMSNSASGIKSGRIQTTPSLAWQNGCGWSPDFTVTIPNNWPSGYYAAKLVDTDGQTIGCSPARPGCSFIPFIVKPATGNHKRLAVLANTNTWNAYNDWGGRSAYWYGFAANDHGVILSFERPNPYATPLDDAGTRSAMTTKPAALGATHHLLAELWVASWLEAAGYDFDVYTDRDLHADASQFSDYKAVILQTHPEYWTMAMRDNLESYLAIPGKKLVYLGGNGIYEVIEYDDSFRMKMRGNDPNANRTDYSFASLGRPERSVLGVASFVDVNFADYDFLPFRVKAETHRFFAGTGLHNEEATIGVRGFNGPATGWEIDQASGAGQVAGIQILAHGDTGADMTYYDRPGGGFVFAAGSITVGGSLPTDANLQRIVKNALNECIAPVP